MNLYSQYFAYGVVHEHDSAPDDLINFDIALVSLAKSKDFDDKIGINYIAKFIEYFCPNSNNYNKLSQEGKDRVDSILLSSHPFIMKSVEVSGCNYNFM